MARALVVPESRARMYGMGPPRSGELRTVYEARFPAGLLSPHRRSCQPARQPSRHMKLFLPAFLLFAPIAVAADPLDRGEPVPLDRVVPANERGILCLAVGKDGVYAGTTGRAAHLLKFDVAGGGVRSGLRLDGGVGFAHAFAVLPDGSLFAGTQAD